MRRGMTLRSKVIVWFLVLSVTASGAFYLIRHIAYQKIRYEINNTIAHFDYSVPCFHPMTGHDLDSNPREKIDCLIERISPDREGEAESILCEIAAIVWVRWWNEIGQHVDAPYDVYDPLLSKMVLKHYDYSRGTIHQRVEWIKKWWILERKRWNASWLPFY